MLEYKQKRNNGRTPFAGVYKFVCVCVCVCYLINLYQGRLKSQESRPNIAYFVIKRLQWQNVYYHVSEFNINYTVIQRRELHETQAEMSYGDSVWIPPALGKYT